MLSNGAQKKGGMEGIGIARRKIGKRHLIHAATKTLIMMKGLEIERLRMGGDRRGIERKARNYAGSQSFPACLRSLSHHCKFI